MATGEWAQADAYSLSEGDVVAGLGTDAERGLGGDEARRRLTAHGPNAMAPPGRPPYLRIAARQFANPLVALLVAAAAVSASIGEGLEALVIGAIVVLNAILGFALEAGAEREVLALHASLRLEASVVRDGTERVVSAETIVPGDLLRIREGDRVPADARVLRTQGLEVDESLLTGESVPVGKSARSVAAGTTLAERSSMVFSGTAATRGSAYVIATATGPASEQGRIAGLVERAAPPPTPLQTRLGRLARVLVVAGVAITLALAGVMLLRDEPAREAFLVGVSVAVAAVPEGLAAILTIALALGSRALSRRGAIVRSLASIETVGEATSICADKTGTLTRNRMRLERLAPAAGRREEDVLLAARAASAAEADPVDRALVLAAESRGLDEEIELVRSLPFEAARKRATVVVASGGVLRSIVKGAPEVVLARSSAVPEEAERLLEVAEEWAAAGVRVLAVASRRVLDPDLDPLEDDLEPLGLVGLEDPLRENAAESVKRARELGLGVKMLTGDHALTAAAIGGRLSLPAEDINSRFTPADKLDLVEHLQSQGEVVAVTGDGVNDAPALRQADVGIAMGESGTEAAREASSLVLTDDDFATIVAAVEEGRRVGANVRSVLAHFLSGNVGEVVLFAVAISAGLGVPMTVVQVLVVNLLTDGSPAIALAADRATAGRVWLARGAPLLGRGIVTGLLGVALVIGLVSLVAFVVLSETRPEAAQTAAFATLALAELGFAFSCRSDTQPPWRLDPNRWLWLATLISLGIVAALLYVPALHEPFGTVALTPSELLFVLGLAVVPFVLAETLKALARRHSRSRG